MNKLKIINGLLAIFVGLPIWFYILYQILDAINASELTWFLFWVYLPVSMFLGFTSEILGED